MKQSITGGGGRRRIPTEEEVEVVEALLTLPKLVAKSELINRYNLTWALKKKRSVLVSKSESSPVDRTPEKVTAVEPDKSPSTPLCFLQSVSGSDGGGGDKPKQLSYLKKSLKRKATHDLMVKYNEMQQEREILIREKKVKENYYQELRAQNLDLQAKRLLINYPRNIEDFKLWNTSMKMMNIDQQHYHHHQQQISIFAPPPQPQQLVVDPNSGKLVAMCTSNSGGRFGMFNRIDPRAKIHGETFDFMAASQPLDTSKYMVMDNDLRVRTAAAARKRRIMRMKENKNSLLAKQSTNSRGWR